MICSSTLPRPAIHARCCGRTSLGRWRPISSDQIYQRVRALGKTLLEWGAQKGDRIALIGENRWEWAVSDFATLAIGTANVPIYPTLTGEQIAALMQDAGCRIAIVSTRQQFEKLAAVRGKTQLERIVIMDSVGAPDGAIPFSQVVAGADERGSERDPEFDALAHSVQPDDLATLIYTSGTTGEPKGVMLTHGNIAANQNYRGLRVQLQRHRCLHLVPAAFAYHRARARLRDVRQRRAGGLLREIRHAAAGHAGDQARPSSWACRACTRRSTRRSSGAPANLAVKKRLLPFGAAHRGQASRRGLWRRPAVVARVEARQQAGLLQGARGLRRAGAQSSFPAARPWASTPRSGSPPWAWPCGKATA